MQLFVGCGVPDLEQSDPDHPASQTQTPELHLPCPEQFTPSQGLGGVPDLEQSDPDQLSSQTQTPELHLPCPEQFTPSQGVGCGIPPREQSDPDHPGIQLHFPDIKSQVPCPEQLLGHAKEQSLLKLPFIQTQFPVLESHVLLVSQDTFLQRFIGGDDVLHCFGTNCHS